MTLVEAIDAIDQLKPNGYTPEEKTAWINQLEANIQMDVMLLHYDQIVQHDFAADPDSQLLLDAGHAALYTAWLGAQIDFANGEYDKYQNSMGMYNALWRQFVAWFANTYHPANGYDTDARRPAPGEGVGG